MSAARRAVPGTLDTSSTSNTLSLGDAGDGKVCRHIVQVLGSWTGTLIYQGTLGTPGSGTYVTLGFTTNDAPGTVATSFTVNGVHSVFADGYSDVRVKVSSAGSGTATFLDAPLLG